MPVFISPGSNPEEWEEKPEGYFTREEWEEKHRPTPEEELAAMRAAFESAIEQRLDAFAKTRGWTNVYTCTARIDSKIEQYRVEARYMLDAMDETWEAAIAILNAVLAGERPMPGIEEVFAELPELRWPREAEGGRVFGM